jgi:hypothetical protein
VKRWNLRYILAVCLLVSASFAAWAWLRPYSWRSDPAARCEIQETLLTRDQAFFWLNLHLKVNPGMTHDLQKPVRLLTSNGVAHEPADSTFLGEDGQLAKEIWFKFWLEPADLTGPLSLAINDGKLVVKAGNGAPDPGSSNSINFTSDHW